MQLTFCLRSVKNRKKETPMYAFIHWTTAGVNHQWKLATGLRIAPEAWNQDKRRAKRGTAEEANVNQALGKIEADVRKVFAELTALGRDLTRENLKRRYDELTGRRQPVKPASIEDAHKRFLAQSHFTANTEKNHRSALKKLKDYCESSGARYHFNRFDTEFWKSFTRYLFDREQMLTDSVWAVLKSLRAFLSWAVEQGLTTTTDFQKVTRSTLPKGEKSQAVYLTTPEVELITNLDLSDNDRLRKVRDVFLFQIWTGKRFSDLKALALEHVNLEEKTISQVLQKNKKAVVTRLWPEAERIWRMYEGKLPVPKSDSKYIAAIKEVAALAGIDTPVPVVKFSGAKRHPDKTEPKYKLVASHTAKRTFVTRLRQRGVSIEAICRETGNTRATIESYLVGTDADAKAEIDAVITRRSSPVDAP